MSISCYLLVRWSISSTRFPIWTVSNREAPQCEHARIDTSAKCRREKLHNSPRLPYSHAVVCLSRKMLTSIIEAARNAALGKVHCEPATEKCPPLVTGRQIAAASAAAVQGDSCEFGSTKYYLLCCLGGTLSCGLTHTMVVPLDLVKCRLQVDKAKYKNLITGFKISVKEEGMRGLAKGWAPTLWGYSAQVRNRL